MNLSARDYPMFRNVDFLTLLSMIFDRKDFLTSLFSTRLTERLTYRCFALLLPYNILRILAI